MPREVSGSLNGSGLRIGIAATRFNAAIVENLVSGALDGLVRSGVADADITVVRCPGSWELPLVCKRLAAKDDIDAVIGLGVVVRGDTPHFDYVAGECVKGLSAVQETTDKPMLFGVLTTDTVEQAMNRAGIKHGNKGFDCALAAIEMCNVLKNI